MVVLGDGFIFPSRSILKIVPSNCLTVLINAWPTQVKLSLLANVLIGIAYGITGCLLLWALYMNQRRRVARARREAQAMLEKANQELERNVAARTGASLP